MEDRKQLAQDLAKKIQETQDLNELSQLIKDGFVAFTHKERKYRVTMLNYEDQLEIEKFRREKYFDLINDDKMMFRKQWIKKYKEKGIDIEAMHSQISELNKEAEEVQVKLATVIDKKLIEKYSSEIMVLRIKAQEIHIEKTDRLSYSIEDQLEIEADSYVAYIMLKTESINKENEWIRVFNTFGLFKKCEDWKLLKKVMTLSTQVSYNLTGEDE